MPRDLLAYLSDVLTAIGEIEAFVSGKEFADYQQNVMMRRAVEREFTIIGEALAQIEHHFPGCRERVDHARKIVDFRNVLIHQYSEVDDELVWGVIQGPLAHLKSQIHEWVGTSDLDE